MGRIIIPSHPSSQPNGHMLILEPSEHVIFQTGDFVDGIKLRIWG